VKRDSRTLARPGRPPCPARRSARPAGQARRGVTKRVLRNEAWSVRLRADEHLATRGRFLLPDLGACLAHALPNRLLKHDPFGKPELDGLKDARAARALSGRPEGPHAVIVLQAPLSRRELPRVDRERVPCAPPRSEPRAHAETVASSARTRWARSSSEHRRHGRKGSRGLTPLPRQHAPERRVRRGS
jgi:hypothetical protein